MKQTVRCTKLFCTCGTPIRACRHSVVEAGAPASGLPLKGGADDARQITVGNDSTMASSLSGSVAFAAPVQGEPAELKPDFAIPLAEKAQAMIAAVDLLSDEAFAALPDGLFNQIQSAAEELQLAIFNYKTGGSGG